MAYCQHGYPCANPACLLRLQAAGIPLPGQQESLLVQGVIQNLPAPPPFPGSNASVPSSQQQGNPPGYSHQQRSPPDPGHWSMQPPIYSQSHPVPATPHAPPPSHPMNTYYPPNPYMQYAPHGLGPTQSPSGLPLPPWLGNDQPAPMRYTGFTTPMAVVGPPAPMPIGGYTPGSQHPQSVFASHPSNRLDPRPDPNRPVQTAPGGWLLPDESRGVPHAWLRGGGDDQEPQEQGTAEEVVEVDAEEDAEEGSRLSSTVLDQNEDEWLSRQGQARSEEDLRRATQPQSVSPEHFMFFGQPDSTDAAYNSRSNAVGFQPSAGNLPTGVVKECHSSHHSSSLRQPLVSPFRASTISTTDQKRTILKEHKAASGPKDPTSQSHSHLSVGAEPTHGNRLRGGNSEIQQASSGGSSRRQEAVPDTSTLRTPSYQLLIPPARVLYLSREGRLYSQVRRRVGDPQHCVFDASALNYTPFANNVCAHEDQISPGVLDHLGIPYAFHERNPHWVIVRIDVSHELLQELLDRTRVSRNYAGECSDSLVGLDVLGDAGVNDSTPGPLGTDRFWATVLDPAPADASGIRGGAGSSENGNRSVDRLPRQNTTGIWREYRLSRTGELTSGGNRVSEADYLNSARPIRINADRRDLLPRILNRVGLQYREVEDNRLEIYGFIPSYFLRSLLEQSRVADAEGAEEGEETEEDKEVGAENRASSPVPPTHAQTGGKNEDHGHPPLTHGHLRGGASSPEGSQPVSPLSPRRRPRESSHEYNRRRLQYQMEIRSHQRANEDREREHRPSSEPEIDEPEDDPEPWNSFNNPTRQRRNAIDLGSLLPWAAEREAPWVLEQEAAHMYRNAPRRRVQRSTPPHESGPHGLTDRRRTGSGDSSPSDENAPFPLQPNGQEFQLWDALLFTIPAGGWLNVTREDPDSPFSWQVFDTERQEVEGGELYDPRAGGGGAGGRANEEVMGVVFAEGGTGGELRVVIGTGGGEELARRGRSLRRTWREERR